MGPTFLVYLPAPLSTEDTDFIHAWLTQHTQIFQRQGNEWDFDFGKDTYGCSLNITPFGAEAIGGGMVTDVYLDEDDMLAYEKALGYRPVTSLQFDNFSNRDHVSHKLLSQFASLLARKYNGVVDLRGAFDYRGEGDKRLEPDIIKSGTYYTVSSQPGYEDYLADADYMDEWIQHPDFRLRD